MIDTYLVANYSAAEILKKEYGNSKNIMTPHILGRGKISPAIAYELSEGTGIEREPIFGLTLVKVTDTKESWTNFTTERMDESKMFRSKDEAKSYIKQLRKEHQNDQKRLWADR